MAAIFFPIEIKCKRRVLIVAWVVCGRVTTAVRRGIAFVGFTSRSKGLILVCVRLGVVVVDPVCVFFRISRHKGMLLNLVPFISSLFLFSCYWLARAFIHLISNWNPSWNHKHVMFLKLWIGWRYTHIYIYIRMEQSIKSETLYIIIGWDSLFVYFRLYLHIKS